MKNGLIVLLLATVVAGGFYLWHRNASGGIQALDSGQRPTTAVVEPRDIHFAVTAAGEISPADQVSVRPEVNGRIATLPVDVGDHVKKGDVLFTLDDRDLQTEKSSTEKDVERTQLQLDQAQRNYQRSQDLYNAKLLSQELYEQTKTDYELAKNALDRSKKSLDQVNDKLLKTEIRAPFDCTVLTRPVSIGQAVSGSGGFSGGTEVMTIANLTDLIINAHINQADVARLKQNQLVDVAVEALPGLSLTGRVERIAPQATIKNGIKGFATRILLKDVDPQVRPGMTANIKIPVASADNVVAAPLAAVFTELNPDTMEQERFVVVVKDGKYVRRPVEIGVADNFFVEVTEGLSAGETVALELPKNVLDDMIGNPYALTNQVAANDRAPVMSGAVMTSGSTRTNAAVRTPKTTAPSAKSPSSSTPSTSMQSKP